jgi:two-component system sensor histidine kinase ChiS
MSNTPYVLIVDDDADAREILKTIITSLGLTVQTAENGREAIEIVAQANPALIMLDLMMPEMNGFEVLFHLRAQPHTRHIPVIVISAVSQNEMLKLPGVAHVVCKANMRIPQVTELVHSFVS